MLQYLQYLQAREGQHWKLYSQPLSHKKQFSQVGMDKLSSCSQEVVGIIFSLLSLLYYLLGMCYKAI